MWEIIYIFNPGYILQSRLLLSVLQIPLSKTCSVHVVFTELFVSVLPRNHLKMYSK